MIDPIDAIPAERGEDGQPLNRNAPNKSTGRITYAVDDFPAIARALNEREMPPPTSQLERDIANLDTSVVEQDGFLGPAGVKAYRFRTCVCGCGLSPRERRSFVYACGTASSLHPDAMDRLRVANAEYARRNP